MKFYVYHWSDGGGVEGSLTEWEEFPHYAQAVLVAKAAQGRLREGVCWVQDQLGAVVYSANPTMLQKGD